MMFLSRWKESLGALGWVRGYLGIYCKAFSAGRILAYAVGVVLLLEAISLFVGPAVPALAGLFFFASKVGGLIVMLWAIASVLQFFDTKKRALSHYALRVVAWVALVAVVAMVILAAVFVLGFKVPLNQKDWPLWVMIANGLLAIVGRVALPIWVYADSSFGDTVKRALIFAFKELPALILIVSPVQVASHYFVAWMTQRGALMSPDMVTPDPMLMVGIAVFGQVSSFMMNALLVYWYQKRRKKSAAASASKTA